MTLAEVIALSIYYYESGLITFKDYYAKQVIVHRAIELCKMAMLPLLVFLVMRKMTKCTGISYVDSFLIKACHTKRESGHRTMRGIAKKSKTSIGWFYGLKLHAIINQKGEMISFAIISENVVDNHEKVIVTLTKNIFWYIIRKH